MTDQPDSSNETECDACKGHGQIPIGHSGKEEDGNAIEYERCPDCGYGGNASELANEIDEAGAKLCALLGLSIFQPPTGNVKSHLKDLHEVIDFLRERKLAFAALPSKERVSISRECGEAMLVSRKEHLYPDERGDKYIREIEKALEKADE